ncbi:MAG: NGG1p interacting factor NIF3 [Methanoculleus sp. SDB]|nr:MAG: NGG1p interacting factor NIF3 [Methanoculleus sp. SDB]
MEIHRFIAEMERIAPPELADAYDEGRIGLVVEGSPDISRVCCALDATPAVVGEAIRSGAEMLVVHHTPLWTPVTSVRGGIAALLRDTLAAGLNIYVMHSNFDHAAEGINDTLGGLLSLGEMVEMSLGVVGSCTLPLSGIAGRLGCPLRVYGSFSPPVRLAVVGGSGFSPDLMEEAASLGADCFLSAELKHSVCRSTTLTLIEATHYALESPGMRRLADRMGWTFLDDPPRMVSVR